MDERAQRLDRMFCEYISLADRIHADPKSANEFYDDLRTRLSRWHLSVENVAWLASLDMGDTQSRWGDDVVSGRQIKACLGAKRWMIEGKHLHVDTKGVEDPPISGNPDLTRAIWENLLDNAIKYTDEGGYVWISVNKNGDYVQIVFRDDGRGIPDEALPHIFERYTQFGDSSQPGGLGLGLAVVKEAALALNGDVFCSSKLGKGTTFQVRLPIARKQEGQCSEQ